jgi:hypothetical protein
VAWLPTGILKQSQMQSCGYCCVGMVVNLIHDYKPSEVSVVSEGGKISSGATAAEGKYHRFTGDRPGAVKTVLVEAAEEEFGRTPTWGVGTYGQHLRDVLNSFRVAAIYHGDQNAAQRKAIIRAASPSNPVITLVLWNGGGGHWVVVKSRRKGSSGGESVYTILDPGADREVRNNGSTIYIAPYGQTGSFAGYLISVQGQIASAPTRVMF